MLLNHRQKNVSEFDDRFKKIKGTIDVVPNYVGNSLRPKSFDIRYWINDFEVSTSILKQ
jgi:hypothetical protein